MNRQPFFLLPTACRPIATAEMSANPFPADQARGCVLRLFAVIHSPTQPLRTLVSPIGLGRKMDADKRGHSRKYSRLAASIGLRPCWFPGEPCTRSECRAEPCYLSPEPIFMSAPFSSSPLRPSCAPILRCWGAPPLRITFMASRRLFGSSC